MGGKKAGENITLWASETKVENKSWLGLKRILQPLHALNSDHLVKWVSGQSCSVNVPLFVCCVFY